MKRIVFLTLLFACLFALPCRAEQIRFTDFDQGHSTIGFAVPIPSGMSEVDGKFTSFTVDFVCDTQDVTKSSVKVVMRV